MLNGYSSGKLHQCAQIWWYYQAQGNTGRDVLMGTNKSSLGGDQSDEKGWSGQPSFLGAIERTILGSQHDNFRRHREPRDFYNLIMEFPTAKRLMNMLRINAIKNCHVTVNPCRKCFWS
jgi:hypothetical protein